MKLATVERELDIDINKVWALLEDFGNIQWAGNPDEVEVVGEGVGMIRRITVNGLPDKIDEVLEYIEPENYRFGYSIPRGLPMPLENYKADVYLEDRNGKTYINWACDANPGEGISEKDAKAIMNGTYNQLIDWLNEALS